MQIGRTPSQKKILQSQVRMTVHLPRDVFVGSLKPRPTSRRYSNSENTPEPAIHFLSFGVGFLGCGNRQ